MDGVLAPGDCNGICDEFAEVASLAEHAGGTPVDVVPPVVIDGTAIAGMSHAEQCQNGDESPESIGLLPTDKDMSTAEPEAIVVGDVGTRAPWFLTGCAEGTEVEFMIDTGCQVTILATLVFECMCADDPQIGTRLWSCNQRLVSTDLSPLVVRGELCMTIVFPGLQCDMILVIAGIKSEGLLVTEALQSCLPHQLDHVRDNCGLMDNRTATASATSGAPGVGVYPGVTH